MVPTKQLMDRFGFKRTYKGVTLDAWRYQGFNDWGRSLLIRYYKRRPPGDRARYMVEFLTRGSHAPYVKRGFASLEDALNYAVGLAKQ